MWQYFDGFLHVFNRLHFSRGVCGMWHKKQFDRRGMGIAPEVGFTSAAISFMAADANSPEVRVHTPMSTTQSPIYLGYSTKYKE
jgi:hypothetical protein